MKRQTIALLGAEEIRLSEAVRRVAEVVGKKPLMFPLPVWCHRVMAQVFELAMKVPLASLAQIRILSEGVVKPSSPVVPVPYDLVPTRRITPEKIRNGLPTPAPFLTLQNIRRMSDKLQLVESGQGDCCRKNDKLKLIGHPAVALQIRSLLALSPSF